MVQQSFTGTVLAQLNKYIITPHAKKTIEAAETIAKEAANHEVDKFFIRVAGLMQGKRSGAGLGTPVSIAGSVSYKPLQDEYVRRKGHSGFWVNTRKMTNKFRRRTRSTRYFGRTLSDLRGGATSISPPAGIASVKAQERVDFFKGVQKRLNTRESGFSRSVPQSVVDRLADEQFSNLAKLTRAEKRLGSLRSSAQRSVKNSISQEISIVPLPKLRGAATYEELESYLESQGVIDGRDKRALIGRGAKNHRPLLAPMVKAYIGPNGIIARAVDKALRSKGYTVK